jgi:hypothetical protein
LMESVVEVGALSLRHHIIKIGLFGDHRR